MHHPAHHDDAHHRAHESRHDHSLFGSAVLTVALGAVLWHAFDLVRATHRRRGTANPDAPPPRVQTWEGEGGNIDPAEAGIGSTG